jgi:methionyl-tRNA formyltransferase
MRIAFLTNKTATVSLPVLEQLLRSGDVELAHTFFYDTVAESRSSPLRIIAQFGVRHIVAKTASAVVSSLRCRLGRLLGPKLMRAKSPYELAVIHEQPHSTISDLNQPATIEFLRSLNVDVLLVCVCKNILRQGVLSLPKMKFINVHPSLLPQYRGPTPTFWMLYHGERETGVTFHLMTPSIDDGEILAQLSMPLDRSKSVDQIEATVFELAATVLDDVLQDLQSGQTLAFIHRNEHQSSYYTFPTQAQRRELEQSLVRPMNGGSLQGGSQREMG